VQGFVLTVVGQNSLPISIAIRSLRQNSSSCSPETGDSLHTAFFKNISVPHGGTPNDKCSGAITRSFEPSTRGGAFRDLNVCVPPVLRRSTSNVAAFRTSGA
jgi:hypothetical protein